MASSICANVHGSSAGRPQYVGAPVDIGSRSPCTFTEQDGTLPISLNGVARGNASIDTAAGSSNLLVVRAPIEDVPLDQVTHLPLPPRFPWLSRLTAELAPVAKQQQPFTSEGSLGAHVNEAA
jgi:hypothetical protein